MPHCPWCKELLNREDFAKHVAGHIEVFRESHPEVPDECEPLQPRPHEIRGDEGAESETEL